MGVAAVNGKIYAIGGATSHSGSPLGIVEEYDPLTDTWDTNKQPMPTARMGAAYGVINNKIYVAGGSTTGSPNWVISNQLEIYDPVTDQWAPGANMLAARYYPQGAVVNDTFYVIGGLIGSPWLGQSEVQKYDPITDNWQMGTSLIHGRVGHTTDVINAKIYAIGGDGQPPLQENVEEYDPQTEIWKEIDTTMSIMNVHTSSVYGNEIFIFSGSTANIMQLTPTHAVYAYNPLFSPIKSQIILTTKNFILSQNYPNPFNPNTTIEFDLPKTSQVTLKIFNILGEEVATLVSNRLSAGSYSYEWDASNLASGVYLYKLKAGDSFETRKMMLMR